MEYTHTPPRRGEMLLSEWAERKPGLRLGHVFDTEPCPIDNAPNQTCTHPTEGQNHG